MLGASASKPLALITFALAPPTSHANSTPEQGVDRSAVRELAVRDGEAGGSRDSYSLSPPRPPSTTSAPSPPVIVSSPAPPISVLARSLPMIVSPKAEPVTSRKPESSLKAVDRPPARFTTTASAAALKSSVLTPLPPFRISTPVKTRVWAPLTIVKSPSASSLTSTLLVTAVKSIVSMPSPSLPPAASAMVSTPQLLAST